MKVIILIFFTIFILISINLISKKNHRNSDINNTVSPLPNINNTASPLPNINNTVSPTIIPEIKINYPSYTPPSSYYTYPPVLPTLSGELLNQLPTISPVLPTFPSGLLNQLPTISPVLAGELLNQLPTISPVLSGGLLNQLPTISPVLAGELLNQLPTIPSAMPTFPSGLLNQLPTIPSAMPTFPSGLLNQLPTISPVLEGELLNQLPIPTLSIIDTKNLPDADNILKQTTNRAQLLNLIYNRHNKEDDMLEGEWMFTIPYLNTIKNVKVYLYPEKNIDKQGELKTSKNPSELINTKLYGFGSFVCNSPNCKIWRIIPVDYNDDSNVFSTFYNETDDRKIAYIFYNPDNQLKIGMIIGAVYLANLNGLAYSDSVKPAFLKLLSSINKNSITFKGFENPHLTRVI